ncbi:HNH endonuclease [Mycobacterium sp. IS-1742]|uniref:HNH endonuclease signature motif containing protein n=1 Tax=Mycobacterium sp. IS-1742 TaxID=1772285 RepID=UPI001E2ECE94|nr:HNH endonuclease [Mycobacterium sp. IS-1742]
MFDGSLPEIADFSALSDAELILVTGGWARVENAAAARRLAAMAEVFRRRTGLDDAVDRDNWFVDPEACAVSEVAAAQNITESLATFQTYRAVMLGDRLPKVAALFAAGLITDLLVRAIVTRTALITDPGLMAAVDTDLADQITTWGPKSANKVRQAIDAVVEAHDPGALRRTRNAEQDRDVEFGFMGDEAGFMTVWARMYAPDGAAFEQRVTDMAHTLCSDDPRPMKERRNDALAAVATGTELRCECANPDCPGSAAGRRTKDVVIHIVAHQATVDAAHAQAEAEPSPARDAAPEPDTRDEEAKPRPTAVRGNALQAESASEGAAEATSERVVSQSQDAPDPQMNVEVEPATQAEPTPAAPRQTACPAPAFVIGAGVTNAAVLAAFLDRARVRPVIHPANAAPEPHYRPSTALQDFVRCRDLTCRFPGCDQPAHRCDIDHAVPYPTGPTCASNLRCLCRKHHLLKTFWTGKTGWRDRQFADGTIVWTSPTGQTYTTRPGSALLFPTLAEPAAPAPISHTDNSEPGTDRGLRMPRRRRTRAQDRARRVQTERRLNDDLVAERGKPPPF